MWGEVGAAAPGARRQVRAQWGSVSERPGPAGPLGLSKAAVLPAGTGPGRVHRPERPGQAPLGPFTCSQPRLHLPQLQGHLQPLEVMATPPRACGTQPLLGPPAAPSPRPLHPGLPLAAPSSYEPLCGCVMSRTLPWGHFFVHLNDKNLPEAPQPGRSPSGAPGAPALAQARRPVSPPSCAVLPLCPHTCPRPSRALASGAMASGWCGGGSAQS